MTIQELEMEGKPKPKKSCSGIELHRIKTILDEDGRESFMFMTDDGRLVPMDQWWNFGSC